MERILIVDDDENISMMLRESLEKEGFACGQAFSGSECLLRLSLEKYDLVLLDLMLPGIDGEQVLQEIRQKGSGVPVIVVSAKDDLDSKVDVLSIGADDYVTKPFEIKEVVARMRVQLRKRTAAAADTLSQTLPSTAAPSRLTPAVMRPASAAAPAGKAAREAVPSTAAL